MSDFFLCLVCSVVGGSVYAASIPGLVPEKNWDLDGYISYTLSSSFTDNHDDSLDHLFCQRINGEYRFSPKLRFNAGMRNRLIWGDMAENSKYAAWIEQDSGYLDLSANWEETSDRVGNSQLDRLYFSWQDDEWLVQGGRFRVNWGMTTIWNPNDIFNVYSVYDTEYAERPGADGFLFSKQLGFASGMEWVFSPASDPAFNRYAGRYFFNHRGWDIQLIGGKSESDRVLGLGISGAIGGAGIRGESSYFEPVREAQVSLSGYSMVSTVETEYRFHSERNWTVRAGILHTAAPYTSQNQEAYLNQIQHARTLSFTRFTAYVETGVDLTALNRALFSAIYYQDQSFYFNLTNQYSLSDNWLLSVSIQHFNGADDSLFGMQPSTLIYTKVRWSW